MKRRYDLQQLILKIFSTFLLTKPLKLAEELNSKKFETYKTVTTRYDIWLVAICSSEIQF